MRYTKRIYIFVAILALCVALSNAHAQSKNKKPYIVFVVGDHEYGSELTMPLIAAELEKNFGMRTRVLTAYPNHESEKNIPGLESLDSADLAVFYLRWRLLPPEQNAYIDKYLKSGRPVVGFRTTTHAFNYPAADAQHQWNSFAEFAFGGPPGWGGKANHTHYGHESTTDVSVIKSAARHPILKGVASAFHVPSWLYKVLPDYPVKGTTWLLMGKSVNPNKKDAIENPVAWTWKTPAGGRSFMTTLGHPEDFQDESFQRLMFNAIHWALNKSAPQWKGKMNINVPYGKHATASNEIPKR